MLKRRVKRLVCSIPVLALLLSLIVPLSAVADVKWSKDAIGLPHLTAEVRSSGWQLCFGQMDEPIKLTKTF
jgi:hypothetical protein